MRKIKNFKKRQLDALLNDILGTKPFDKIRHEYGFDNGDMTKFFEKNYGFTPCELRAEANMNQIEQDLQSGLSISRIAKKYDIGAKVLSYHFEMSRGVTIAEYANRYKKKQARQSIVN